MYPSFSDSSSLDPQLDILAARSGGAGYNTLVGTPNDDLLVGGPDGNSFDGQGSSGIAGGVDSEYGGAGDDSFVVGGDGASHEHLKIDGGPSGNKTLVINDPLFDQEGIPTDITNQYTVSAYSAPGATPGLEPVSVTDSTTDTAITADRVASISIVNVDRRHHRRRPDRHGAQLPPARPRPSDPRVRRHHPRRRTR